MMDRHISMFAMIGVLIAGAGLGFANQESSKAKDDELRAFFTPNQVCERLNQIRSSLSGYHNLVEMILKKSNLAKDYAIRVIHQSNIPEEAEIVVIMKGKDLRSCSNLGWDYQNIAFPNWMKYVEGYIEFQEYENLKLRLELMKLKSPSAPELNDLTEAVRQKKNDLANQFLDQTKWVD